MGGIHTLYRKSTGSNFVAVESNIYLPVSCANRDNSPTGSGQNGAFPEFFHGFYKGSSYGLDIGIIYKNGAYYLAFYSYANTQPTQWFTSKNSFNVGSTYASRLFTLKSYFQDGYLVTRCHNSSGTLVASLDVKLTTAAYESMSQGCTINREMCLAINPNASGKFELPAECYFSQAKWTQTKMTTVSGTEVAMTNSNTTTLHGKIDNGLDEKVLETVYAKNIRQGIMEGNYVADVATATFDKSNHPVSAIV